ncbi:MULTISPECIES: hypothetical protein [unclassified Microcystis]|jgi:hypothetical protein|uniref:hypothetical protein n=1 Tax=unclassified Microcystis TaxID=2643300 RepID=UPI0022C614D8|nr:hypothetical protein [Microcystis sp. LE19-195.1E]MCZ8248100.1 hypothetical protein [Microcystis sp. LE19-195.1E]
MNYFALIFLIALFLVGCTKKEESSTAMHTPTPEVIAEAKRNPGGWVYKIQGSYGPNDAVPPEDIAGAWKVDAQGNITGEFVPNPNFRKRQAGGHSL